VELYKKWTPEIEKKINELIDNALSPTSISKHGNQWQAEDKKLS
jgi:hypothetical protein